jgi:hypothetical protein
MRMTLTGLAVLALTACGPAGPQRAASDKVVEQASDPGAMWPVMLQHCLRSPSCDPTSNFGQGAGQASGLAGAAVWLAETKDVVKEGGQDYGAAITISLYAQHGTGGPAGRPLTIDESPDSLRGADARRSTLSIEYRTPGGGAAEPYFLAFRSAQLALADAGVDEAKVEIRGKAGLLYSSDAAGMESAADSKSKLNPLIFYAPRNLRDEPLPKLLAALSAGETLSLKVTTPDGALMLSDAIYAMGYDSALAQATAALADPEINRTILERCERFTKEADSFWKVADMTPTLLVCDPRTPEQRRLAQQ